MNKRTINNYYFLIFIISLLISLISCSNDIRSLNMIQIQGIGFDYSDNIKFVDYKSNESGTAYFYYDISKASPGNKILLTIHNHSSQKFTIKCILSSLTELDYNFNKKDSICTEIYESVNYTITNIIFSFNENEIKSGDKLYLKLDSKKYNLIFFVREKDAYKDVITTQDISYSFAYTAFEFNVKNFYNKQYLLTSSKKQGFLIFGHKDNKYLEIDETSALPISEQSLSAHFWDFDKIIIFAGKSDYNSDSSKKENILNITLTEINNDNVKLYYYTGINFYNKYGFSSFHSECIDKNIQHYLVVNYRTLDIGDYYYKFNNLIGSDPYLADFPLSNTDITKLDYSKVKRINDLTKKDYSIHVFKFECSGESNKILANLQYTKKDSYIKSEASPSNNTITDYLYQFEKDKGFTLSYDTTKYEFILEIFTPNSEDNKIFNVEFENKKIQINNKDKYVFTRSDNNYKDLTIKSDETIEAVISFFPSIKISEDSSKQKYLSINTIISNSIYYSYYEIDHKYDANYFLDIEINNPTNNTLPFCYYLTNMVIIQNVSQNCILLPSMTTQNITFKNIFKYVGTNNFNIEEPKYSIVMYNNHSKFDYEIKYIYYRTDLAKSTPINTIYEGHDSLFLETSLEKNKDSYYNVYLDNVTEEYHFDLYILNDVSKYEESKLDIKCISSYEVAIKIIEPLFTEENNICHYINKEDYKSNVSHIIFKGIINDINNHLLIKITPKEDMKVRFLFDTNEYIIKNYEFDDYFREAIHLINEPSVYKIVELNRTNLEEFKSKYFAFYDRDVYGMEFYARNQNEFKQIYKKENFIFMNINEVLDKYKNYSEFLFVFGKNDCKNIFCTSFARYQVKYLDNVFYKYIDEFNEYYRYPININKCKEDENYYMVFNYGKKYKKENLSLGKYAFIRDTTTGYYLDTFKDNDYEQTKSILNDY